MESMIEKVAKAIEDKLDDYRWAGDAELAGEGRQNMAREIVRATLEAMRYPTNEMADVGTEARWRSAVRDANSVREIWSAMIDAALKEHEG